MSPALDCLALIEKLKRQHHGEKPIRTFTAVLWLLVAINAPRVVLADAVTYTFLTLNAPGARSTALEGINNFGQAVGFFQPVGQNNPIGFLYSGGNFIAIQFPGSVYTLPTGINRSGQIVGSYLDHFIGGTFHGFLYSNGVYATLDFPGSSYTTANAINDNGDIVGTFNDHIGAFLYSNGSFSVIGFPGAKETSPTGINNTGQIVGVYWLGSVNDPPHGFVEKSGSYTTIDFPGAQTASLSAINNQGQIVGSYPLVSGRQQFIYGAGVFATITFSGATVPLAATGINDSGQLSGFYTDQNGEHGFVATPASQPGAPVLNSGGIVNGAIFSNLPMAAASIASAFGSNFASSTVLATTLPVPTTLGGVTILINGIPAPLFAVTPQQINFQIPWEVQGLTQASIAVTVNGIASSPVRINLAAFNPGIFTINQQGSGQGAILIGGTAMVAARAGTFSTSRPARYLEYVTIFCTGMGAVTNQPASGVAVPTIPQSLTTTTPMVTVGGIPAFVSFSGLAPGFVGLYQVNVQVPSNAPTGDAIPVVVTVGGVSSNTVTIAVQ